MHSRSNVAAVTQPASYTNYPAAAPVVSQPAEPAAQAYDDGYYPTISRPVYVHPQQYAPQASAPGYGRPVVQQQNRVYEERYRERREYRHGRSKEHSAEIVAGSAGVGAAIGAIAGGGKGAAIGALTGGAAGFSYDRLTHNR
jgi:hypothetical protein